MNLSTLLFILTILFSSPLIATKICLNMIVKNEKDVIQRCLNSIKQEIDYWVIVDTGSTDGTERIIQEVLKDIPGELHHKEWINFAHNRNEAMVLAKGKGDYLLLIDADEVFENTASLLKEKNLDKDLYFTPVIINKALGIQIQRPILIRNSLPWQWEGVIHEQLKTTQLVTTDFLDTALNATFEDGCRTKDPNKWLKDAIVLEKALVLEPNHPEYIFYLAQSYWNAKEYSLSLKNYQKRAALGGWDEQIFWSLYMIGILQETLKMPFEEIVKSYEKAFLFRKTRAEPLYRIACLLSNQGGTLASFLFAKEAKALPKPHDIVYIEHWVYEYGSSAIFAHTCLNLGLKKEASEIWQNLTKTPTCPDSLKNEALHLISLYEKEAQ